MKTFVICYADGRTKEIKGKSLAYHTNGLYIFISGEDGHVAIINNGPGVAVYEKQA